MPGQIHPTGDFPAAKTVRSDLNFPVVAGKGAICADKTFLDSMRPEQLSIMIDLFSVPYFLQCLPGKIADGIVRPPIIAAQNNPAVGKDAHAGEREGAGRNAPI